MKFFRLDLRSKTLDQKISDLQAHVAAMAEAEQIANFPVLGRKPSDAEVAAFLASIVAARDAADALKTAWKQANAARDAMEPQLDQFLTVRANDCEATKPGDIAALTGTALAMKGAPAPASPLGAPQNFRVSMGDPTEVDTMWESEPRAVSTTVRYKEHLATGDWVIAGSTTKSKFTVEGLTPGKTYAFQAQFLGTDGVGPWSDEAVKMAP
ncbi:MAG TPA: fibronectin type III domain-containing protein [Chthoniobacteraceae bacterium]|jgi:hypothetical protein|nr:fibronectin type III domain-containing protein [Chthoniobacteraceae bacterium]